MAQITYDDKVALYENTDIADINKVKASDMNEIKASVNNNDDMLNGNAVAGNMVVESIRTSNILPYSYLGTQTQNGITITNNNDGTYTVNGTATADVSVAINNNFIAMNGTWRLLGCPEGGSNTTYMLSAYVGYWGAAAPNIDTGEGTNITYTGDVKIRFYIKSGTTCTNLVFKPMITYDTTATRFSAYQNLNPSVYDTGWLTAFPATNFAYYDNNYPVLYRRVGKTVHLVGTLKPTAEIPANQTTNILQPLPEGFRPNQDIFFVCQASGINRWALKIKANGNVTMERYGTTTNIAVPSGSWLPFTVCYVAEN